MKTKFLNVWLMGALAFGMTFTMYSCGDSAEDEETKEVVSEKGNWTDKEKARAQKEVDKVKADLEVVLGDDAETYINCYLEKVENAYPDFDSADSDQPGCEKLAMECMEEMM